MSSSLISRPEAYAVNSATISVRPYTVTGAVRLVLPTFGGTTITAGAVVGTAATGAAGVDATGDGVTVGFGVGVATTAAFSVVAGFAGAFGGAWSLARMLLTLA